MIIIFSPNCQYGDVCELKTRVEIFKKEVAMDNFLMRFKIECIFTPEKYFQHLQDRSSRFIIRNENFGMGKEITALVKNLKEIKQTAGLKNNPAVCLRLQNYVKSRGNLLR